MDKLRKIPDQNLEHDFELFEVENTPDYGVDKWNDTMHEIIKKQGEVPFLKRIGRLIRKHARIKFNRKTGELMLLVAGIVVFDINLKEL